MFKKKLAKKNSSDIITDVASAVVLQFIQEWTKNNKLNNYNTDLNLNN